MDFKSVSHSEKTLIGLKALISYTIKARFEGNRDFIHETFGNVNYRKKTRQLLLFNYCRVEEVNALIDDTLNILLDIYHSQTFSRAEADRLYRIHKEADMLLIEVIPKLKRKYPDPRISYNQSKDLKVLKNTTKKENKPSLKLLK